MKEIRVAMPLPPPEFDALKERAKEAGRAIGRQAAQEITQHARITATTPKPTRRKAGKKAA